MSRRSLPPALRTPQGIAGLAIALLLFGLFRVLTERPDGPSAPEALKPPPPPAEGGYLLVFWNVENLFDDRDDPKNYDPLDAWFASDPEALASKHARLVDELLELNDGRGPDLLALVEVENRRAVELLQAALNARLSAENAYDGLLHDDNIGGRRIEPAVLTRLPIDPEATRALPNRRVLIGRVYVADAPLGLIVSHWTSRVTDSEGGKRTAYAEAVYEAFLDERRALEDIASAPADVIICGDFNDEPDDPSVIIGLRATGDAETVAASIDAARPRLLNLMAGRSRERHGTYRYRNRWQLLDHLVASPGLLDDRAWRIDASGGFTIRPAGLRGLQDAPRRFGNEANPNPRGASDHFAVGVWLKPPEPPPNAGAALD